MHPSRAERLREIFDEAAERPRGDRAAFVRRACAGDEALLNEVLLLLESLETKSAALEVDPQVWFQSESEDLAGPAGEAAEPEADGHGTGGVGGHPLGVVLGDFELLRPLGCGGVGSVYEARQISLGRVVAVKLLHSWGASRDARRRFVEEAAILARLKHPDIAQVIAAGAHQFDLSPPDRALAEGLFGDVQSLPWIAMELVDGARTIVEACRGASVDSTLRLFARVAEAVHYGHQQGFIHRDLKPANILVNCNGEPKVIDFGIAKAAGAEGAPSVTVDGAFLGSPRYMSPEQCDGRGTPVDTRSDVFALGTVLYEALTGQLPHAAGDDSLVGATRAICEAPARDPRQLSPNISADAAMVVLKALAKAPGERYQSAAELAADLRRVLAREPITARRPTLVYSGVLLVRRRPVIATLSLLAIVGLVVGFVGISLGLARERAARREADRMALLANLTAADSSIRLGDGGAAMRRLSDVPVAQRGWEWRYLRALADTSISCEPLEGRPDGAFIASTGRWISCHWLDGRSVLVNRLTGVRIRHEGSAQVSTTAWNSDETLAALNLGNEVCVIDLRTQRIARSIPMDSPSYPLGCAFSPDSSLIAVGRAEGRGIEVYDLGTGQCVFRRASAGWIYIPAFSLNGRTLMWSDESTLESVDTSTWRTSASIPIRRVTRFEPGGVAASPDGRTVAVICGTFVQLVDLPTRSIRAELRGHAQRVHSAQFDAAGERVVTTSIDRTVRVWDAGTGALLNTLLGCESPTRSAAFVRAGTGAELTVIAVDETCRLRSWDLRVPGPVRQAQMGGNSDYIRQLMFDTESPTLRAVSLGSTATIDLSARAETFVTQDLLTVEGCIIPGQTARLRQLAGGRFELREPGAATPRWAFDAEVSDPISVSPDGRLFFMSQRGHMCAYQTDDGKLLGPFSECGPVAHLPSFSPDSRLLTLPQFDGRVTLCDVGTRTRIRDLVGPGEHARGSAFSPDGTLLAFCHARDGVTIMDTRSLRPVKRFDNVGGYVWSIAFSPDNTRLAIGAQDRITHIYDLSIGQELLQLRDHTGSVMRLAWSPDGRYLASGGYDKRVIVYDGAQWPRGAAPE